MTYSENQRRNNRKPAQFEVIYHMKNVDSSQASYFYIHRVKTIFNLAATIFRLAGGEKYCHMSDHVTIDLLKGANDLNNLIGWLGLILN